MVERRDEWREGRAEKQRKEENSSLLGEKKKKI